MYSGSSRIRGGQTFRPVYTNDNTNINTITNTHTNTNTDTIQTSNLNNNQNLSINLNDDDSTDSTDTLLPDYESISSNDELINHIQYDITTNSLRISIIRIENNINKINKFGYYMILINVLFAFFSVINYGLTYNNSYNFTEVVDNPVVPFNLENNDELNKKYQRYNSILMVYVIVSIIGYVGQNLNYYWLRILMFLEENKDQFYTKKKMYNILCCYNQLIPLMSIFYIFKTKKDSIDNYLEISIFVIHFINYMGDKVVSITLNINMYLNLY
jgi:hypothetical protein